MMKKEKGDSLSWEQYFSNINPVCTKAADKATNSEYPEYQAGGDMTDTMTRTWYAAYLAEYEKQISSDQSETKSMSIEEQAHLAYEVRHHARVYTREHMIDKESLQLIQNRDFKGYGNKDGPTFEWLVEANLNKGQTKEQAYQSIIDSALTTNMWVNMYVGSVKAVESVKTYAFTMFSAITDYVAEKVSPDLRGLEIKL